MLYNPNPYMGGYPYVGIGSPLPNPNQMRQQVDQTLNNYQNAYQAYQTQPIGGYAKVSSYKEVENAQVPANGQPMLFIDETSGVLYSKKFENGQAYIQGFNLTPLQANETSDKVNTHSEGENSPEGLKSVLSGILDKIDSLEKILNGMEGRLNERHSANGASDFKNEKPTGLPKNNRNQAVGQNPPNEVIEEMMKSGQIKPSQLKQVQLLARQFGIDIPDKAVDEMEGKSQLPKEGKFKGWF